MIIYDCEIVNAIPNNKEPNREGIKYCKGWSDFVGMGISCIVALEVVSGKYRVFCKDNLAAFQALVDSAHAVIGYNSIGFDNKLCEAAGVTIPREKSVDLLVQLWKAAGLGETFQYPSHIGFGLDDVCRVNFGTTKSGHGALAPVDWQLGRIGSVIDYCINNVRLTRQVFDQVVTWGWIRDPRNSKNILNVKL